MRWEPGGDGARVGAGRRVVWILVGLAVVVLAGLWAEALARPLPRGSETSGTAVFG